MRINLRGAVVGLIAFWVMTGVFYLLGGPFELRSALIFAIASIAVGWGSTAGRAHWTRKNRGTR